MACHKTRCIGLTMITNKLSTLCLNVLLLASAAPGCMASPESPSQEVKLAPLAINGVEPGMSLATVARNVEGKAESRKLEGFISLEMKYPSIIVGFDEFETVALIESRSVNACILTMICPGAPLKQMQQELEKHGYLFEVFDDTLVINGDGCWGEVRLVKNRASSVRVQCPP